MILEALCFALTELCSCLLIIVVCEYLWPSSDRFPDCRCDRASHSHKQLTSVSDISDGIAP